MYVVLHDALPFLVPRAQVASVLPQSSADGADYNAWFIASADVFQHAGWLQANAWLRGKVNDSQHRILAGPLLRIVDVTVKRSSAFVSAQ